VAKSLKCHVRELKNAARRLRKSCESLEKGSLMVLRIAALADIERDSAVIADESESVLRITNKKLDKVFKNAPKWNYTTRQGG